MRPTMATAMLLGSGWDGTTSLADPFCGSGTIAIEAALLACGVWRQAAIDTTHSKTGPASNQAHVASAGKGAWSVVKPLSDITIEATDHDDAHIAITKETPIGPGCSTTSSSSSGRFPYDSVGCCRPRRDELPYGKRVGDGDMRDF
ncbi:MAG: hypothetical protein R2706_13500 [Acidimicrobiales bacterium]